MEHNAVISTTDNTALEHLIARSAMQDRNAFEKLYESTSSKLLGHAVQLLKNRDKAEEALQDAFVKIWYNAGHYHSEKGSAMAWMSSIVRYRALDILRSEKKVNLAQDSGLNLSEQIHNLFDNNQQEQDKELEYLLECLEELQEHQKKSILMAFYDGHTHQELADRLQKPLGTIKSWIRRGLDKIKRCLDE